MGSKMVDGLLPSTKDRALSVPHAKSLRQRLKSRLSRFGVFILFGALFYRSIDQPWTSKPGLRANDLENDIYPDDDLPLRPATEHWDISNSYPYPRILSKNVTEGTWLRIATHPTKDEIVFDMLGDLYCMKATSFSSEPTTAVPFLQGVPYDKDASFSPDGRQLVFISDAGFGVDNIWTIPYTNCEEMSSANVRASAIQQTNSTFRFFTSPVFHPKQPIIMATKWFLTGRPNGAGEIWEFPLLSKPRQDLPERGGRRIISRKLPASWPKEKYFESQLGVEQPQYTGLDGEGIIFTRNVRDDAGGKFSYGKDVHKGINAIFLYNRTTGATEQLVDAFPGGANVPRLSHDGKTLAYVKRTREREVLAIKDLTSGTVHYAWDGLTYDVSIIPAFMGAYPSYGFSTDDTSIIIWSQGQIWKVPLAFNQLEERVAASKTPVMLPFQASVDIALGSTRYSETDVRKVELKDYGRVHVLRGLRSDERGENVIFEAAGDTYVMEISSQDATPIPKLVPNATYYHPSFVNSDASCILHARWDDHELTTFEITKVSSSKSKVIAVPRGRYLSPVIGGGYIAFIRTGADMMLGDTEETAGEGIWLGEIDSSSFCSDSLYDGIIGDHASGIPVTNLRRVDRRATQDIRLEFSTPFGTTSLLVQAGDSIVTYNTERLDSQQHLVQGKTSTEMAAAKPSRAQIRQGITTIAFRDFQNVWIGHVESNHEQNPTVWSKPDDENTPSNLIRLSPQGGHDVVFSSNGKVVFWAFGAF
jgi:WD40-like Beta Propeller Repeat